MSPEKPSAGSLPLKMTLAVLAIVATLTFDPIARGEDLLPPDRPIEEVVDHYIDAAIEAKGLHAAPPSDDATIVRRLTLDLVGRIPTAAEVRAFVESTDPDKRAKLVDRLMASPGYARHQAEAFDAMMMAGVRGNLREYLARALKDDRPWDAIFREVMTADESDPARKGVAEFLKPRTKDLDSLTNDVSTVFFGVNVSCAKCHDHPRVRDWKQDHFYGMKSFLVRTFQNGDFLAERDYGSVKFKTTAGVEKQARTMFLTGTIVDLPGVDDPPANVRDEEKKRLEEAKKAKTPPPRPIVSARAKLVEVALQPGDRDFFDRAIVNRLWHRFFGLGLVTPLDQMHAENPPSHPELLQWLARDMADHRYDLRRPIRGLVLSRAYARASAWESAGDAPDPRLFAVAATRPLTPMQLATSMWVATADPQGLDALKPDELERKFEGFASSGRGLSETIARPGEEYQIGAAEALLLSNGDKLKDMLADGGDRIVGRLLKAKDDRERIDLAYRNALSRAPDDDEIAALSDHLARHSEKPAEGCRQLVWALLTGAEFRFNH